MKSKSKALFGIYGLTQFNHGHEYRLIFNEETLVKQLGENFAELDGEDIGFPIGGSNSSATWIKALHNMDDVKKFLASPGDGPDLEDPTLVDIAEYLVTVDCDYGSITQDFLDELGLKKEQLTQTDDIYGRQAYCNRMINSLKEIGYEGFAFENPFYGENRDMRYSELIELYRSTESKRKFLSLSKKRKEDCLMETAMRIMDLFTDKHNDFTDYFEILSTFSEWARDFEYKYYGTKDYEDNFLELTEKVFRPMIEEEYGDR